jgi:long-chain fatty acid transport protein
VFTVGRIGENYAADDPANPSNTVLQPPPFGLGPVYSKLSVTQIVPSVAFEVTDRLSVGFAPTISIADAAFDPFLYTTPGAPNAYPPGTHTRLHWGLGLQAGVYWELDQGWRLGASYKSPQWFESFDFASIDTRGVPQQLSMNLDYPGISSIGVSYAGHPRWLWALDLRYVDYDNAEWFGHQAAFDPTGRVTGLGWRSVFSVATGLQYELIDCLTLRAGYVYTENPIPDEATFFNIPTTAIYEHVGSIGATWKISQQTSLSLAYVHAFENTIRGSIPASVAGGPGSTVAAQQSADALTAGLEVRF